MKDNAFMMLHLLIRRLIIYHIFSKAVHFKQTRKILKFILELISLLITSLVFLLVLLLSLLMGIFIGIPAALERFLESKGIKTPKFFTNFIMKLSDFIMPCSKNS